MRAFDLTTGQEVKVGTVIKDFRGESVELVSLDRPNSLGKDGKVSVKDEDLICRYYARVVNLRVER